MSEREAYIEKYALWLLDLGPFPDYEAAGLTFDEKRKCETPALIRAYELEDSGA